MANQKDIAKHANVSQATVSRFINNIGSTSVENEIKILSAIKELNYRPNVFAQSLKTNKSNTLGFVFSDIKIPLYTHLIHEAENVARANNYNVIIGNSDNNLGRERKIIDSFRKSRVEGFLIEPVASDCPENYADIIRDEAVVFVTRNTGLNDEYSITLDNYEAMRLALEYLLELGHTRIGMIMVPISITAGLARLNAYKELLHKHNIQYDEKLICHCEFDIGRAYENTLKYLQSNDRPTALLCLSRRKTVEALKAVKKLGIKIPEELSMIGFDDFETAELLDPPMTMVWQPISMFGSLGIEMLFKRINGMPIVKKKIVLKPQLMIRESCRKIINRE